VSESTAYYVVSVDAARDPPRLLTCHGGSNDYVTAWRIAGDRRKTHGGIFVVIDASAARLSGLV
jgi:hypothetical protein